MFVPHSFQQLLGADDPAVGGEQFLEDAELLPGQRHRLPPAADPAPDPVDGQVPAEHHRGRGRAAAGQRTDPRDQFGEGERFPEVVVGTQVEAIDPLVDRGGRGQHEDPGLGRARDQARAYRVAGTRVEVPSG